MTTEVEFANKFIQLLSVNTPSAASQELAHSFKLNDVKSIPDNFTFPPLKSPYIKRPETAEEKDSDEIETDVEITFKSLKQPKFNLKLILDINSKSKIFHVKEALSNLLKDDEKLQINVHPADIRLMIRTKSVNDSDSVNEILQNAGDMSSISFNVLISKFTPIEKEQEKVEPEVIPEAIPTVTTESWNKISDILYNDLKDQSKVNKMIEALKKSF